MTYDSSAHCHDRLLSLIVTAGDKTMILPTRSTHCTGNDQSIQYRLVVNSEKSLRGKSRDDISRNIAVLHICVSAAVQCREHSQ